MKYTIHYYCESNVGKHRPVNQDNFICDGNYMQADEDSTAYRIKGSFTNEDPALLGVFDGMGGEAYGEIASLIAASAAAEVTPDSDPLQKLREFCDEANNRICKFSSAHSTGSMGTTAAMLAFTEEEIILCNIGDSKIFRFYDHNLKQISMDHTTPNGFGRKPALTQNLGISPRELIIEPFFARGVYQDGDIFLICSDGLTDMVEEQVIREILTDLEPKEALDELMVTALENGGKDNITIILCSIEREHHSFFGKLLGKSKTTK